MAHSCAVRYQELKAVNTSLVCRDIKGEALG
jgi:hypothetical protein